MAIVTEVLARISANPSNFISGMNSAAQATDNFQRSVDKSVQASSNSFGSLMDVVSRYKGLIAGSAVGMFAKQGIDAAAKYEQQVISFEGIFQGIGKSAEEAQSYLVSLRDFAARTPFELPGLLDATKRLLTLGYTTEQVRDTVMPTIGDMVAALGQPPSAINAVVYAFGQMKSAGRVLSQDLMQIGNALPGFNAKMAIANSMFGGNMRAMNEAMEKGTLKSEQAIEAMLDSMRKFPGAAGAMERQSLTLEGVLSTFRDTINNARIDGFYKSLKDLSAALVTMAEPTGKAVEGMSQLVGSALPPLAKIVSSVAVPALEHFALIMRALQPPLDLLFKAVGAVTSVFEMLPEPLRVVITMFALLKTKVIAGMLVGLTAMGQTARLQFALFRMNALSAAAAMTTTGVATVSASTMIAGGLRAIGLALKGLLASIPVVGWALLGLSAAIEAVNWFFGRSKGSAEEFAKSLQFTQGVLDDTSKKMVADAMATDGVTKSLESAGVATNEYLDAVSAGGEELEKMRDRLKAVRDANVTYIATMRGTVTSYNAQGAAADKALKQLDGYSKSIEEARKKSLDAAVATGEMTSEAAKNYQATQNMKNAQEQLTAAVDKTKAAFTGLTEAISSQGSYDAMLSGTRKLIEELSDGAVRGAKSFDILGAKGKKSFEDVLANRAALRDSASAALKYAESLKDPIEQQKVLTNWLTETRAALTKSLGEKGANKVLIDIGINPNAQWGEVLTALKNQADAEAKVQGLSAGATTGNAMVDSMLSTMAKRDWEMSTAGSALGQKIGASVVTGFNSQVGDLKVPAAAGGKPAVTRPTSYVTPRWGTYLPPSAGPANTSTNYNFYGDLKVATPQEAARQASLAARLKRAPGARVITRGD